MVLNVTVYLIDVKLTGKTAYHSSCVILYNNLTCFTTRPASYGGMICYQSNEMMTNLLGRTNALLH